MAYQVTLPKLRRWEYSVSRSDSDQIPDAPTITLQDLPVEIRSTTKEYYHRRDWEHCHLNTCRRPGTQFKLMKCAGCGIIAGHRTLYCSKKCQREAWPDHKLHCLDAEIASAKQALKSGVDVRIWRNCTMLAPKRKEGLKLITSWAFDQIMRVHANVDLRQTCLAIHCRSTRLGKGNITPVAYQLYPMAKGPFGLPPSSVFTNHPGRQVAVVLLVVDRVYHEPDYIDLNSFKAISHQIDQWPWIFATILTMRNYSPHLAVARMQQLCSVVEILVKHKKAAALRFKAPADLDSGQPWQLYDWEEWEKVFGDVVGF